jgi:hypothetical protein
MNLDTDRRTAQNHLTHHTGIIITVYLHSDARIDEGIALLSDTVESYCRLVADPAHIVLSIDGPGPGQEVAQVVANSYGVQTVLNPANGGKLAAGRLGAAHLLQNDELYYLALVDQDGDHFANELLNFLRMAVHVAEQTQNPHVLIIGSRLSKSRSMGLLRAEGEELANRILLDALHYHAARTSSPLPLQYLLTLEPVPDFHAGYKLFSRHIAEQLFTTQPNLCNYSADAYFRHAIEAVMTVESHLAGATIAAVSRRTYDEQPVSLFAQINRARLTADLIIWPCKRLDVPGPFVAQWLANHLPCLSLSTLVPEGRAELLAVAHHVHAAFNLPAPDERLPRPRFI